jgi:hypothetical protein
MLSGHRTLEGHAVGLVEIVADPVLGEIKPFLLLERCLKVLGAPQQPRLALLADAALEDRLDENGAVPGDQVLDLAFRSRRPQDFRYLWFDPEQNLGVRTGSSCIFNRIHLNLSSWSTYRNGSQPSDYLLVTDI